MGEVFNIGVESALTGGAEWTDTVIGSGQALVRDTNSGLYGTAAGAKLTIGGTTDVFAYKTFPEIASTEATFRFATSGLASLTVSSGTPSHRCYRILSAGTAIKGWIDWRWTGSAYTLQLSHLDDVGSTFSTSQYTLTEATTYIQMKYEKSSSNGATDAAFSLYFNDTLQERKTGLEIWDTFNWVEIRLGAFSTVDSVTTGDWIFDEVVFRDDGTLPGSPNTAPVLTVPGTQTCTLGAQQSVTGVSVSDTNLSTIRVQHSGSGTCTVTLSGTTVSSGTNGTNDFTLSGTQANLNTAIGTLKADLAQVAWTDGASAPPAGHISAATTITITATDAGSSSDVETITCNWTMATGNGTKRITLSHATLAGINAAMAAASYIPNDNFTGTDYLYVKVTDGNGATDEAIIDAVVSQEVAVVKNLPHLALGMGLHL